MGIPFFSIETKKNSWEHVINVFPDKVGIIITKSTTDAYAHSQITVPVRRPDVERKTKVTGGALKNSGQLKMSDDRMTGEVFYTMYYAGYVHEGTIYVSARPFLKDAFHLVLPAAIAAFGQLEAMLNE
jgi:hypothetical protein